MMTQSFLPHLSENNKPLPPTFFPLMMNNNNNSTNPFHTEPGTTNSNNIGNQYVNNPFSQPFPILKMPPMPSPPSALVAQSISTTTTALDNSSTYSRSSPPLTLHQKKLMKTDQLIRAKRTANNNHSDSSSSSSSSSSSGDEMCPLPPPPETIKPIQTIQSAITTTLTTTRKNSAVGELSTTTEQKPKRSTPPSNASQRNNSSGSSSIPILSFSNFWKGEIPSHSFACKEGFLLNDSKKAPPDTSHNLTIRDSLHVSSQAFNRCTCKLKLKDGSADGVIVSTEAFKPNNLNNVTTYECTVTIPQKITTLKGSSSSRIGYIEIYNQEDECIAVSSFFWIRSRSRLQLDKDTKRKLYVEPTVSTTTLESSSQQKRKREDNDDSESVCGEKNKMVKTEQVVTVNNEQTLVVPAVVMKHEMMTNHIPVNNTLPPISSFCVSNEPLQMMYNEIMKLKEIVSNQQREITQLKERLGQ